MVNRNMIGVMIIYAYMIKMGHNAMYMQAYIVITTHGNHSYCSTSSPITARGNSAVVDPTCWKHLCLHIIFCIYVTICVIHQRIPHVPKVQFGCRPMKLPWGTHTDWYQYNRAKVFPHDLWMIHPDSMIHPHPTSVYPDLALTLPHLQVTVAANTSQIRNRHDVWWKLGKTWDLTSL